MFLEFPFRSSCGGTSLPKKKQSTANGGSKNCPISRPCFPPRLNILPLPISEAAKFRTISFLTASDSNSVCNHHINSNKTIKGFYHKSENRNQPIRKIIKINFKWEKFQFSELYWIPQKSVLVQELKKF